MQEHLALALQAAVVGLEEGQGEGGLRESVSGFLFTLAVELRRAVTSELGEVCRDQGSEIRRQGSEGGRRSRWTGRDDACDGCSEV